MLSGSGRFFDDVARQDGAEQICFLLTLEADGLGEPLRFVNDITPVVSRGLNFMAFPFDWREPPEGEGSGAGDIVVSNVSKNIGETIAQSKGPLTAVLEVVLRSEPDVLIRATPLLAVLSAEVTALAVTLSLEAVRHGDSAWPGIRASKNRCPGVF